MNPLLLSKIHAFLASEEKVFTIKGKAGTGKTHKIKEIEQFLEGKQYITRVATPTNKAANVLRQRGIQAKTIHKLLYQAVPVKDANGTVVTRTIQKPIHDPEKPKEFLKDANGDMVYEVVTEPVFEFAFSENKLFQSLAETVPADELILDFDRIVKNMFVLILDESSMINAETWKNLIENTRFKIIAVGDVNQLDPVETEVDSIRKKIDNYDIYEKNSHTPEELFDALVKAEERIRKYGNYFCRLKTDWELTINHRTKSTNIVNVFSSLLNSPNASFPHNYWQTDVQIIPKNCPHMSIDAEDDLLLEADIVIAHQNHTVNLLNTRIRQLKYPKIFQKLMGINGVLPMIEPGEPLYVNSRYFDVENDINVDKGEIIRVTTPREDYHKVLDAANGILYASVVVDSDGRVIESLPINLSFLSHKVTPKMAKCSVSFAYAITCHKAQGSQWKRVVVWDEVRLGLNFNKKWRYTAITRAEDLLTVLVK